MTVFIYHMIAVWLALFLDKCLGDPLWLPHPVKGIGFVIAKLDGVLNKGRLKHIKGFIAWLIVCSLAFFPTYLLIHFLLQVNEVARIVVEAIIIYTTIAEKDLARAGRAVFAPLQAGNLVMAREKVGWIVGRDTNNLNEEEVVRATVETIAENTSDGVTAPLFYAFIGGAPLALLYRAVNTCDSMLGYKNEKYHQFGFAAAKFDDLFNLIPSRITGFVMIFSNIFVSPNSLRECLRLLLRDATKHPSPNSGWCEAAMAALLQVQLGGRNTYNGVVSERARMGDAVQTLQDFHIEQSIKIMKRAVFAFVLLFTIGVVISEFAFTWS